MTERPLIDISPENWQIVRSILERYIPDREVWAFGSRVKWTAKEFSDLDIAVMGNEPMDIGLMADLSEAFQESALPFKVDIVDWATITASFRKVIETAHVQLQRSRTMAGWTVKLVSDIAALNPGRSLKKGTVSPFVEMAALPVNGRDIPAQEVTTREFSGSGSRFMDGDVLLARITPCLENGKTALVDVLGQSVVGHGSTEFIVLSAKEASDQRFVYYLARHPDFREYAIQHMEGTSGRQRVSAGSVGAYRFLCPPPSQRKEIGEILGALDDKISLLREANTTLETIAHALFKSWFVDFDPVLAKAEGRVPEGVPPEVADLFPSEFMDSELGEIPKGWKSGMLADIAQLNPESWTARNHPATVSYIDLANTKDNVIADIADYAFDEAPSRARRVLRDGDTIVGTVRPGNRSFAYIHEPPGNLTASTGFAVLRPTGAHHAVFLYLAATQDSSIEYLAHVADGAAYPAVRPEVVAGIQCAIPNDDVMRAFQNVASPMLCSIAENHRNADALASLRDALLPRLMSGKLSLRELNA